MNDEDERHQLAINTFQYQKRPTEEDSPKVAKAYQSSKFDGTFGNKEKNTGWTEKPTKKVKEYQEERSQQQQQFTSHGTLTTNPLNWFQDSQGSFPAKSKEVLKRNNRFKHVEQFVFDSSFREKQQESALDGYGSNEQLNSFANPKRIMMLFDDETCDDDKIDLNNLLQGFPQHKLQEFEQQCQVVHQNNLALSQSEVLLSKPEPLHLQSATAMLKTNSKSKIEQQQSSTFSSPVKGQASIDGQRMDNPVEAVYHQPMSLGSSPMQANTKAVRIKVKKPSTVKMQMRPKSGVPNFQKSLGRPQKTISQGQSFKGVKSPANINRIAESIEHSPEKTLRPTSFKNRTMRPSTAGHRKQPAVIPAPKKQLAPSKQNQFFEKPDPRQVRTEQVKEKPQLRQQSLSTKSNKSRALKQMMRGISGANRMVQRNKHSQDLAGIQQAMMADQKYQPYTINGDSSIFANPIKLAKQSGGLMQYGARMPPQLDDNALAYTPKGLSHRRNMTQAMGYFDNGSDPRLNFYGEPEQMIDFRGGIDPSMMNQQLVNLTTKNMNQMQDSSGTSSAFLYNTPMQAKWKKGSSRSRFGSKKQLLDPKGF